MTKADGGASAPAAPIPHPDGHAPAARNPSSHNPGQEEEEEELSSADIVGRTLDGRPRSVTFGSLGILPPNPGQLKPGGKAQQPKKQGGGGGLFSCFGCFGGGSQAVKSEPPRSALSITGTRTWQ